MFISIECFAGIKSPIRIQESDGSPVQVGQTLNFPNGSLSGSDDNLIVNITDLSGSTQTKTGGLNLGGSLVTSSITVKPASGEGIVVRESDDGNDAVKLKGFVGTGQIQLYDTNVTKVQLDAGSGDNFFDGSGNLAVGTTTARGKITIEHVNDHLVMFQENVATADKGWLVKINGGDLEFLLTNGEYNSWVLFFSLLRNGLTPESMQMSATMGLWQRTQGQIQALAPLRTGEIIFNTTDNDIYVSTGTAAGSWKNSRTNGAP